MTYEAQVASESMTKNVDHHSVMHEACSAVRVAYLPITYCLVQALWYVLVHVAGRWLYPTLLFPSRRMHQQTWARAAQVHGEQPVALPARRLGGRARVCALPARRREPYSLSGSMSWAATPPNAPWWPMRCHLPVSCRLAPRCSGGAGGEPHVHPHRQWSAQLGCAARSDGPPRCAC